jgi:SAM-dependent methyltransferase
MPRRVDYEQIAASYECSYDDGRAKGRRDAIRQLAADPGLRRAVELGCGTGHWLDVVREAGVQAYGVDLSPGMLREGGDREAPCACADACAVPFADATFGLAFCVNALHHFGDPAVAIAEAHRVLRVGGRLAVMGGSPHGRRCRWYGFEYFDGVWERTSRAFPDGPRWPNG